MRLRRTKKNMLDYVMNDHRELGLGTHSKRPGDAIWGRNPNVMNRSLTNSFYFSGSDGAC